MTPASPRSRGGTEVDCYATRAFTNKRVFESLLVPGHEDP